MAPSTTRCSRFLPSETFYGPGMIFIVYPIFRKSARPIAPPARKQRPKGRTGSR